VTFAGTAPFKMDTTGTQEYRSTVQLNTDMTFNSDFNSVGTSSTDGIRFVQGMSGAGRNVVLTARDGTISAERSIGGSAARFNTVSAAGRNLVVGEDIWTQSNITLSIGTANSETSNDFLQFNVPGASPAEHNTRIDSATGEIILGSGAVTGTTAKSIAPFRASLFKSNAGDLYLFAHKITIQPFERLAVRNGSLVAIADGTAATDGITLSNTAVSNNLILVRINQTLPVGEDRGSFRIRSRGFDPVIGLDGTKADDRGTELVAGAVMFFHSKLSTVTPTREKFSPSVPASDPTYYDYLLKGNMRGTFGPLFITVMPDATDATVTHPVYVADLVTSNTFRPILPNLLYLDLSTASTDFALLRDKFITPALFGEIPGGGLAQRTIVAGKSAQRNSLEQAFTPNVPREDNTVADPEPDLAAAVREQLQALGIYARALTPDEKLARERWAATFITVPERERPTESDYQVADARVEDKAVRDVIRFALDNGLIGEGQAKLEEIRAALEKTYEAYRETTKDEDKSVVVLVTEYREWLQANRSPDAVKVLQYVQSLRRTLRKIELLGLTEQELEGSKAQIYGSVLRARLNVEPEFLRTLVEGSPADALWDIKNPPPKEPKVQAAVSPRASGADPVIN